MCSLVMCWSQPIVELSFMPSSLARDTSRTIMHYKGIIAPPKDYDQWADLVKALVSSLIDRYGLTEVQSWKFEVWNEREC